MTDRITTPKGAVLLVEKRSMPDAIEVSIRSELKGRCLLHWGIQKDGNEAWLLPPRSIWPEGTSASGGTAVQTPFANRNGGAEILIRLDRKPDFASIVFVLFYPDDGSWDNNSGRNYRIEIPGSTDHEDAMDRALAEAIGPREVSHRNSFQLDDGSKFLAVVTRNDAGYHITLLTDLSRRLLLHWGVARRARHEWLMPPSSMLPDGTDSVADKAVQSPFIEQDGLRRLDLQVPEQDAPMGISFVLHEPESNRWIKDHGRNFFIPVALPPEHAGSPGDSALASLANEIIEQEMGRNSWTLMHRYNLCYDLLERTADSEDGLALIYVWLRYSYLRQLDWQRNFNTKPRELGHSLDRLTLKIADLFSTRPGGRRYFRMIMTTLGRGTDAQRVRDEVLNIMHRHHIKEVSGHFMEEWHQKLHNNTTPDDIVICRALIDFYKSDGNRDVFYNTLEEGGVTRERLESFERPIRSAPDFIPHLKDALIGDFEHFLGILKEVHSGSDLGVAIKAARPVLDETLHRLADFIWEHRDGQGVSLNALAESITQARRRIAERFTESTGTLRELLFLDLALEQFLRVVLERSVNSRMQGGELAALIEITLENLTLSDAGDELALCHRHWGRLAKESQSSRDWPLKAKAVVDRLERAVGSFVEDLSKSLQPKAEFLGRAFHADSWTIGLFSEEVVRGRLEFALSSLLGHMNRELRSSAHLGKWQVISPRPSAGRVEITPGLKSIQGKGYLRPTVVITDKVDGDEEIPEGVAAVVTQATIDIVSHVAIRARNAGVFLATCYEPEELKILRSLAGKEIRIFLDSRRDVSFEEIAESPELTRRQIDVERMVSFRPAPSPYVIASREFNHTLVGGKSNNLKQLNGKLPKWIGIPSSVALPFGVFEKVLAAEDNREAATLYGELAGRIEGIEERERVQRLEDLRAAVLKLAPPKGLVALLQESMKEAGLPSPESWDDAWTNIKRVWASKWNDRAFLSRRANGIPHDSLFMAVLIQRVVEADYGFVIHTVNPFTTEKEEVYAEVVLGLGETLVGNYPGRALSFTCRKEDHDPVVLTYPAKSTALYGGGLMFRSDSNGEDLAGYAGAGLYDSFMLPPPRKVALDYTNDLLFWNEHFRKNLLVTIALIGKMVENAFGSPQDIEGAYSKGQYYLLQTRPQVGMD
jgi:alpha-glucan,water dikinase